MSDSVLETVAALVRQTIGEDWADELEITRATSFADDLELESIEFVTLAELLQEHYGDRVDFVGWLGDKELDAIISLRVGDLTEFVEKCLES